MSLSVSHLQQLFCLVLFTGIWGRSLVSLDAAAYCTPVTRRRAFGAALVGSSLLVPGQSSAKEEGDEEPRVETTNSVSIPQVGYSLYKTDAEQVPLCVELALLAGVHHLDVASQYGTNDEVGQVLDTYIRKGIQGVPYQPTTKVERRRKLFVSHKISNQEQSDQTKTVKKTVKKALKSLKLDYLDLCSVHSPLTDASKRLATYNALLELQEEGVVRAVGVCNYGVNPLEEIVEAGLPAPSVNQLVLSPFNQHKDVAGWAKIHGTILSCSAWSRLSSAQGPQEGWAVLADMAKVTGLTKAQVMVRWALQKGYVSVPRSGSKYKIERAAIQENSYNGVKDTALSDKDMKILDGLDQKWPVGRLGIVDGWSASDILGEAWDPTLAV